MNIAFGRTAFSLVAAAVVLGSSTVAMAAAPKYKIEVVRGDGNGPAPTSIRAINDQGVMVGQINGIPDRFSYTLARYAGPKAAAELLEESSNMNVKGINADGEVLADRERPTTIWKRDGTRVTVPLSLATAFNNKGWLTGATAEGKSVVLHDGVATPLEKVDWHEASPFDINDAGISVGRVFYGSDNGEFNTDAAIWDTTGALQRLTVPGARLAEARSVNKAGHLVGTARIDGVPFSFFYDGVTASPLPKVNGQTVGWPDIINDRDEVLGSLGTGDGPVLWRKGRGYLLRDLLEDHGKDWEYLVAYDMNNAGQIVGWGRYKGKDRGFIAKRVAP